MNSKKQKIKRAPTSIQGFNNHKMSAYLKNLAAILLVKFTFYLVISIFYVWLLVSLGFKNGFDWNLAFLITISLLLFSMMFEKPYPVQVVGR